MLFRKLKRLVTFIIFVFIIVCGYIIYENSQYVAYTDNNVNTNSKVLAKVGEKVITQADINSYRDINGNNLIKNFSDKDILNKLIEDNVLIKAAKDEGVKVSKNEVQKIISQNKSAIEKDVTKSSDDKMEKLAKGLGITIEKYWNTYAPRAYASLVAIGKERNGIKDKIISEISKSHPNWSQAENEKAINDMYQKKLEELKKKYAVEIFN